MGRLTATRTRADGRRLFVLYAFATAVPIAVLGVCLGRMYQSETHERALDQAVTEARALVSAGIEPRLAGGDLDRPLLHSERAGLTSTSAPVLRSGSVLRLRLRTTAGEIVFDAADPNREGTWGAPDDDSRRAATGQIVRRVTNVDMDPADGSQPAGDRAVEIYAPVYRGGTSDHIVGVMELYLPYDPIETALTESSRSMRALIAVGLGGLWAVLSVISWSVTGRLRRTSATNEHLALHDTLTDLPNRVLFADRVDRAIASARRAGGEVAIAIVDIDRFKEINDTLGHHNGDNFLRHVAATLSSSVRAGDTVARLGGDEFGLILEGANAPLARTVLERVRQGMSVEIDVDGIPVSAEVSIGFVIWPNDGAAIDELLQNADLSMYVAKDTRSGIVEFSPRLEHFSAARLALVSQLRRAIGSDELVLHYQPKLDLSTGQVMGFEALVRWQHPSRGLLPPSEFLEAAEATGLIDPLSDWVFDHAIAQVAEWHAQSLEVTVAVNISARNLLDEALPEKVFAHLRRHGVPPWFLAVELTETAVITHPAKATALLERLHQGGVRVSLDDFGQGYSSLSHLASLPLSELKIDRSFITAMTSTQRTQTIVGTVIQLGHQLGLEVVAEGVETEEVAAMLASLGCDTVQGFAFAAPLEASATVPWVTEHPARPRHVVAPARV